MIDTQAVMRALPLVASVLGRKYGITIEIGGNEAYTDGSTIHLPSLPLTMPTEFLALARGYVDHEAGHIRETDFEAIRLAALSPLEKHVWNILEDYRVEKALANKFPGCRGNFNWLIQHVFGGQVHVMPSQPAPLILNWLVLVVRSWDVPSLGPDRDAHAAALDTRFPGLRVKLEHVLGMARSFCPSTEAAIAYARDIVRVLGQFAMLCGAGTLQPTDDQEYSENAEPQTEAGNPSQTEEIHAPKDSAGDQADRSPDSVQAIRDMLSASETDLPPTMGETLAQNLHEVCSHAGRERLVVAVPTDKTSQPLAQSEIQEALRASAAMRTRLQGLVQTAVQVRSASSRKGKLDTKNLYRLAASDPRVFRGKTQRAGLDTAVHILVDCSGSMVRRIKLTSLSCYAVAKALEPLRVNVAITAFPGNPLHDGAYTSVAPVVRHGQRVHGNLDLSPDGSTPMGEALWWVMQTMLPLREARKIILILTDGDPDSHESAVLAIRTAQRVGFEVRGIGINSNGMKFLLPESSQTIQCLSELSEAMFNVLQHSLLHKP